jgi:glycosyltransferase involved in cell wall biosynthesis
MARQRLLVINTSRSWGGTEFWAVQVASGMARRGVDVRVLVSSEAVAGFVEEAGLDHRRIRLRGDADLPGVARLFLEMRRFRPHTVLTTRWREHLLSGLAVRIFGRRRPRQIMFLGQYIVPREDLKRRLIFRLADRVIVNAHEIRRGLEQRPWIDPGRISVVIGGLDLSIWRPRWEIDCMTAAGALRRNLGISFSAPLLLNVGSLTPVKDHAGLLRTVNFLRERISDVRLLILGEGFLRHELAGLCRLLGLQDTVLMPGFMADVAPAMAAADLLVHSSYNEGMAWVLIEAAASGLPAVATDVSGTRLAVDAGISGLIVPPHDPQELARALEELLADPDRRRSMGRQARSLAEERFSVGRMIDQVSTVLFVENP